LGENYDEIRLGCGALPLRLLYRAVRWEPGMSKSATLKKKKKIFFFIIKHCVVKVDIVALYMALSCVIILLTFEQKQALIELHVFDR